MTSTSTAPVNCPTCSKPLTSGGTYCPFCGTQVVASPATAAIDAQVQKKIDFELANRLKDQSTMVRELADKVEDVVWKRFGRYTVLLGLLISIILGIFAFYGITTFKDASSKIEPIVQDAVHRAETAKQNVDKSAAQIETVKSRIDSLSSSLDAETRRVTEKTSEISTKLAAFDATQKKMEAYLNRADVMSQRLDAAQESLETRVQQVSNQADDVALKRIYPNLGKDFYVVLNGQPWRDKSEKKSQETWVNINILTEYLGKYSPPSNRKTTC